MSFGWQEDGSFECPAPEPRAKLEDWSYAANHLFAAGCEAQAFALLCSFASPLLSLMEPDPASAVCSLHGGAKSGKTVALVAAATVWGDPRLLAQAQGKGQRAKWESLGNLPVIAERLANRDPSAARDTLFSFAARGRRKEPLPWCGVMLAFGGMPLVGNVISSQLDFPGVELETNVPRGLVQRRKASEADELIQRLVANRGIAGQKYLEVLAEPKAMVAAAKAIALRVGRIRDEMNLQSPWHHAVRLIAAANIAGQLAVSADIIEADVGRITSSAATKWCNPKRN